MRCGTIRGAEPLAGGVRSPHRLRSIGYAIGRYGRHRHAGLADMAGWSTRTGGVVSARTIDRWNGCWNRALAGWNTSGVVAAVSLAVAKLFRRERDALW